MLPPPFESLNQDENNAVNENSIVFAASCGNSIKVGENDVILHVQVT